MVIVNLVLGGILTRVREKLLNLDFDALFDVSEASTALTDGEKLTLGGHEDALVDGLEPHRQGHGGAGGNRNDSLSPLLIRGGVEVELPHLPGSMHEIVHVHAQDMLLLSIHHGSLVEQAPPR